MLSPQTAAASQVEMLQHVRKANRAENMKKKKKKMSAPDMSVFIIFIIDQFCSTYRSDVSAGQFLVSLHHNMQYSLFCPSGVRDGGANVIPQVHRPPQYRCFWMGRVSLVVVLRTGGKKSSSGGLGTNQNICFVKFTFTDCLVEFSLWKTRL